mmetsp:Transcript_79981/g.93458  ORF Transcript_79981/g.93458 Transcript_79981/m.93458 type:complete len:258 (-) Transcript_79981:269-1042(-)
MHETTNSHDHHHSESHLRCVLPPKLVKVDSMDRLAEEMHQMPKLEYQIPSYQQYYNPNDHKTVADQYYALPGYPKVQQQFNTNMINPALSTAAISSYTKIPSDITMMQNIGFQGTKPNEVQKTGFDLQSLGKTPFMSQYYPQSSMSNSHSDDELFHLAHKKLEKVPLEAQPDKDFLYFAMIDTKTHEIYLMSQVTQANYGQTFDAIVAENQSNNNIITEEKEAAWPFDSRSNGGQDFPEVELSRDRSDFMFDFNENQ